MRIFLVRAQMDYYPVMERVALQLAGLQARVILGEPGQTTPEDNLEKFGKNLPGYLPRRIRDRRSELEFSQAIAAAYKAYGKGKSELVCKVSSRAIPSCLGDFSPTDF